MMEEPAKRWLENTTRGGSADARKGSQKAATGGAMRGGRRVVRMAADAPSRSATATAPAANHFHREGPGRIAAGASAGGCETAASEDRTSRTIDRRPWELR